MSSIYNGQFSGNVLVVGKIGCGKTYFLQKLGLNKFFGSLVKTEKVSVLILMKKDKLKYSLVLPTR